MKKILIICLIIVGFGCGRNREDGKIKLVFWHSFVPSTLPALDTLISDYEKENPNVSIEAQYVPTGDALIQKLITSIQSKTAPDMSWIHSDFLDKLVEAKAILPISYFNSGPDKLSAEEMDDIFPALIEAAKWKDTLYALPMEGTVLSLLYNKTAFLKAGLDPNHPPADWKELYEYAAKLTFDKDKDGKTDQYGFYIPVFPASGQLSIWMVLQWSPFLWQAGGKEINDDQSRVTFNDNGGVLALNLWKDIYQMLGLKNFSLSHDMGFLSQSVAMVMDGPWNLPLYRKIKNFEWGVAPLPKGPAKSATYFAGEHVAIFKQSKYPTEAWKFLKYIVRPDVQAKFSMNSGYLPIRQATLELQEYQDFLQNDAAMKSFVEQIQMGQARAKIDHYRVEINQSIAASVEKTILGNGDAKKNLDEAARISNNYLKRKY